MNLDIDSGKLLYALGILFAAAAFVYFVRDLVFGLSITVKALLLLITFIGFFITGAAVRRDILDVVAFVLSGVAYVVFVGYVLSRYQPGDTTTFLLFAGSAILFVGLGYYLRQQSLSIPPRTASLIVLGLVAVSVVLVGADLVGGDVTYTMQLKETVTVTGPADSPPGRDVVPGEARLGTVTATNEFIFSRPLDLPPLRGCVVGTAAVPDDRVGVRYEQRVFERTDVIPGSTERTYTIKARIPITANETQTRTFNVERRGDCDVSRSDPTIIVVNGRPIQPN